MRLLRPVHASPSLEEILLDRYATLVRLAAEVTGSRLDAEDLVQDACVRLLLVRPDLERVATLDAYLRVVLRNLFVSQQRRRATRVALDLSVLDYDSIAVARAAVDPREWLQSRDMLRAACRWACARRWASKTGSAFLLRYFHGYLPSEMARLARTTRNAVDMWLGRARGELRAYLEDPGDVAVDDGAGERGGVTPADGAGSPAAEASLADIQAAVFAARHARCFSRTFIEDLYRRTAASAATTSAAAGAPVTVEPIPTRLLAELVTCPACLDLVNEVLGLPRLDDRHPTDSSGHAVRGRHARRVAGVCLDGSARLRSALERSRLIFEHRPARLYVYANGFQVGSQIVSGSTTSATVTVTLTEPLRSIEVCSEQSLCLAYVDVSPAQDGALDQRCRVDLSDDRFVELGVSLVGPWPTVCVTYRDPEAASEPLRAMDTSVTTDADPSGVRHVADARTDLADVRGVEGVGSITGIEVVPVWSRAPRRLNQAAGFRRWLLGGWSRRPLRMAFAVAGILLCLLAFAPGSFASAARRAADACRWLIQQVWRAPESPQTLAPPLRRSSDILLPSERGGVPPRRRPRIDAASLASLEVDALIALDRFDALVGGRLVVERGAPGLVVRGLVEESEHRQLRALLRSLPHAEVLRLEMRTLDEAVRQAPPAAGIARVQPLSFDPEAIPVATELRARVASPAAGGDVEREVHRMANDGLRRSRQALVHALTIESIAERIDDAVRTALAASSEPPGTIALRDPAFWHVVRHTEMLARQLAR